MSFTDDLHRFEQKLDQRLSDVFLGSVTGVSASIVEGSEITGAPGQPVDDGFLIGSWGDPTFPEEWVGLVSTHAEYAPAIEDGQQEPYTTASGKEVEPRPMTLLSEVGGFHSVKMTRANFDLIVRAVVREAVR
jgi:hypothetical protein